MTDVTSTQHRTETPAGRAGATPPADPAGAEAFAALTAAGPLPARGPVDTRPICLTPSVSSDLEPIWRAVVAETRARGNDIHLPLTVAYAERLCAAYPQADDTLVRVTALLHDTGWARVDETRIISEGFGDNWRASRIRFEHEQQGCEVAREVLPPLGYDAAFVDRVCAIIDGHDTRTTAYSLEDALVRDADRAWRFDHVGIALASSWFGMDPATYTDRLEHDIVPEFLTEAGRAMALADLERSRALLKTGTLR